MNASQHDVEHDGCNRFEVGCWYHARRRFWEAAIAKNAVAREGRMRIGRTLELDEVVEEEAAVADQAVA